jgi:aspartyl-tRNA(Asn)/glutamyl-tRNA(Gln) amidotransferase subunit C
MKFTTSSKEIIKELIADGSLLIEEIHMAVTIKDVEHIAKLAKLEFNEDEKAKFTEQFNEILAFMEKLNELDTSKVEPLSHVIELQNVFRDDAVKQSLPTEEALKNAPAKTEKFFKVPKVIDK